MSDDRGSTLCVCGEHERDGALALLRREAVLAHHVAIERFERLCVREERGRLALALLPHG